MRAEYTEDILTFVLRGRDVTRLKSIRDPPHLIPDFAVDSIGPDQDIAIVRTSIGRHCLHSRRLKLDFDHLFADKNLVLMLEVAPQLVENHLAVNKDDIISKPEDVSILSGSTLKYKMRCNLPFPHLSVEGAIFGDHRAFRGAKRLLAERGIHEFSDLVVQTDLVQNTGAVWKDSDARTDLRGYLAISLEDQVVDAKFLQHVCQREAGYASAGDEDGEWLLRHGD